MDEEKIKEIEGILEGVEDKHEILKSLVIRNIVDIFNFISGIKQFKDRGYYFGVLFDIFKDISTDKSELESILLNYQCGELDSSRDFYYDIEKMVSEELEC